MKNHIEKAVDEYVSESLDRRGFLTMAEQQFKLEMHNGTARGLSLLFADMDGLKKINDTFGHEAGSRAIVALSRLIKSAVFLDDFGRGTVTRSGWRITFMEFQNIIAGTIIFLALIYIGANIWRKVKSVSKNSACGTGCGCGSKSSAQKSC